MATDTEMKIDYAMVLKQLQHELDTIVERRAALEASIASFQRLLRVDEEPPFPGMGLEAEKATNGHRPVGPAVPPGFFEGKAPTQAYRDLMKLWPGEYTAPQVADSFERGGLRMDRTKMLQAIHSVRRRERERVEQNGNGNGA